MPSFYTDPALDAHGQPKVRGYNMDRRFDRASDEFIGLAKGVLFDDILTDSEIKHIGAWLMQHQEFLDFYPFVQVAHRLHLAFADGRIDEEERQDLMNLLHEIAGGIATDGSEEQPSGTAFFCTPMPDITFKQSRFVFTGKFACAKRSWCEAAVRRLGGVSTSDVTQDTDYLVVGVIGSTDWIHTPYGRKIERAILYRERNRTPRIISESHWMQQMEKVHPGIFDAYE